MSPTGGEWNNLLQRDERYMHGRETVIPRDIVVESGRTAMYGILWFKQDNKPARP